MTEAQSVIIPPPYPGLRSFNSSEQLIFFGRDSQVEFMTDRLEAERFLCITGPSGCGKSSLARTGLISGLRAGQLEAGEDWVVLDMHPANDPFDALVKTISDALEPVFTDPETAGQLPHDFHLSTIVERSLEYMHHKLSRVLSGYALFKERPVVLLVDQFEEVFEYAKLDFEGAARFVRLLLDAVRPSDGVDLYVVITIRADALDNCSRYDGLAEAINRGQFLTPALNREELSEIIRGPVALHAGDVDPAFVGWLLNQMAHEPDRLPLLQHVMNILWNDETERLARGANDTMPPHLDIDDFKRNFPKAFNRARQMGDALRFAMSDRLDEVYEALEDRLKPVAEKVFCALVQVFAGDKDIKRRQSIRQLSEVCSAPEDDIRIIVDHFRRPGRLYLHPGRPKGPNGEIEDDPDTYVTADLTSDTVVRVMHECLLRQWRKLREEWILHHERAITELQFLARTAMSHARQGGARLSETQVRTYTAWRDRHKPNVHWGAPFLRTLEWREDGGTLTAEEVYDRSSDFLNACERDIKAKKEHERQRRNRRKQASTVTGALTIAAAIGFAGFWYQARLSAQQATQKLEVSNVVKTALVSQYNEFDASGEEGPPLHCADVDSDFGLRADGDVEDADVNCVADLNTEEIDSISSELQGESTGDEQDVEEAVSRALEEQREEASARAAAPSLADAAPVEDAAAAAATRAPQSQNVPLIEAGISQRRLTCDEIPVALEDLEIEGWETDAEVRICKPKPGRALADIPGGDDAALEDFETGRAHLNRGRNDAALEAFGRVYASEPNIPRVFRYVGWAHIGNENDAAAWTCFREAVATACRIEGESERDEQLVWGWSNLTAVPERKKDFAVSAAAWAQKAMSYDLGEAYSAATPSGQSSQGFRMFEANLNAYRGFDVAGGCSGSAPDAEFCGATEHYLVEAGSHLRDFVDHFPTTDATRTLVSQLTTAAWEWATDDKLRRLDMDGTIASDIVRTLQAAAARSGASGPFIPLSLISCQQKDLQRAVEYRKNWPRTAFEQRRARASECIDG